jgi:photosystem II stability/assembly factor-like uncharacterized protein
MFALPLFVAVALSAQQPHVTQQVSGVKSTLEAVSVVNPMIVWASGSAGTVLRTRDGGDSWEKRAIPGAERLDFRGIHAISANEAWALSIGNGPASRIFHTADGGATWTEQFRNADATAFFDCITFFDARHGVAYSDASQNRTTIIRTEDGGAHWALLPESAVPAPLKGEGGFASSNSCAISIDSKHGWIAASEPGARVFRSDDAGKTWSVAGAVPVVHDSAAGLTALSFRDSKHGIGVGAVIGRGNMMRDSVAEAVATTSDGGATWTLMHRPGLAGVLSGVALVPGVNDRTAVIAGYGGVTVSLDGGESWTTAAPGYYWAVRAAGKRAWAVGRGGMITRVEF